MGGNSTEDVLCCICHEEMQQGDRVLALSCEHTFHHNCVKEWLGVADTCPTCRLKLDESTVSPPRKRRTRRAPAQQSLVALTSTMAQVSTRPSSKVRKWRLWARMIGRLMCVLKRVRSIAQVESLALAERQELMQASTTYRYALPGRRGDGSRLKQPSQCCIIS